MRRVMHVWWWCVRGMEVAGEEHRGVERCAVRGTMCCPWNDGATWNIAVRTGLIRCAPGPLVRTAKVFRHSRAHESPFYARDHRRAHGTRMGTRMGTGRVALGLRRHRLLLPLHGEPHGGVRLGDYFVYICGAGEVWRSCRECRGISPRRAGLRLQGVESMR